MWAAMWARTSCLNHAVLSGTLSVTLVPQGTLAERIVQAEPSILGIYTPAGVVLSLRRQRGDGELMDALLT